jgi:MFS family permease
MGLGDRIGVLRECGFRRFYIGYAASLLGTAMSPIAIAWAVLGTGGGAADLGYVMTANVVPQVVLMAVAGAIGDRFGRRRVMLGADVVRCLARVALAGSLLAGHPALWLFIALALLGGTGDAFFSPALGALTVEIAPADRLGDANAMYGLANAMARIGGPALSGVLVAFAGPALVVALDAGSFGGHPRHPLPPLARRARPDPGAFRGGRRHFGAITPGINATLAPTGGVDATLAPLIVGSAPLWRQKGARLVSGLGWSGGWRKPLFGRLP